MPQQWILQLQTDSNTIVFTSGTRINIQERLKFPGVSIKLPSCLHVDADMARADLAGSESTSAVLSEARTLNPPTKGTGRAAEPAPGALRALGDTSSFVDNAGGVSDIVAPVTRQHIPEYR